MASAGSGGQRRDGPRVVGLGLCVEDHLYLVDDIATADVRTRYRQRRVAPGGMATNALLQAAALGCRAQLLSAVGDDREGRALLRTLRAHGVATRSVVRSEAHPTTSALVLVDRRSGERRFVIPDRRRSEREAPRFELRSVDGAAVLLVDGHYPREAARAVARARARRVPVVADLVDGRPAHLRLLRGADHPIVPHEFVGAWGRGDVRETLRALAGLGARVPVVTLGRRGALALVEGRFRRIPPHRVRSIDTTGAGDAFHGAFAAGIARGLPVLDALDLASRAGADACRRFGANEALLRA